MLVLDREVLFDARRRRRFVAAERRWIPDRGHIGGKTVSPATALAWLQTASGHPYRVPVGVIGPRHASRSRLKLAENVGAALSRSGLAILCGGRQGIMEAVCRGVARNGGLSIGLLPEADAQAANRYVTVPIATGIGEARNALIARGACCLVAIGNSYGTLSEVALGLQFGKPVFGLAGAARIAGVRRVRTVAALLAAIGAHILALDDRPPRRPV